MSNHPPLWKQLAGALMGAVVAVGLYSLYGVAAPMLGAYIVPPGITPGTEPRGTVAIADKELTDREERLKARAKESVDRMKEFHATGEITPRNNMMVAQLPSSAMPRQSSSARSVSAQKTASVAMVASASSRPRQSLAGSPNLPSSGPATALLVAGALTGACVTRRGMLRRLFAVHSRA